MKITASSISDLLNLDKSGIHKRSKKENWPYVMEKSKGGLVKHFIVDQLPDDIRLLIYKERDMAATQANDSAPAPVAGSGAWHCDRRGSVRTPTDSRRTRR